MDKKIHSKSVLGGVLTIVLFLILNLSSTSIETIKEMLIFEIIYIFLAFAFGYSWIFLPSLCFKKSKERQNNFYTFLGWFIIFLYSVILFTLLISSGFNYV